MSPLSNTKSKLQDYDWVVSAVGEHVTFIGGSQPPRSTFRFRSERGYIRLLQIRDYKSDEHETFVPEHLAKRFCNATDIMIGRYGPPIFQILRGKNGAYNVALIKAVPGKHIDRDFLFHFLCNETLFNFIEKLSQRSSGQTGIDLVALRGYPLPTPPLNQQKSIAKALSDTDALINSLEKLIAKKRAIKTATMQQLLTGKTRLAGFGEGKGYKDTELGRIPEDWSVVELKDVADVRDGTHESPKYVKRGIPLITSKNLIGGRLDFSETSYISLTDADEIDKPGQIERKTQNRVVQFFQSQLGYKYYGTWHDRENNKNIEPIILTNWLKTKNHPPTLIKKALRELDKAAALGEGKHLYDANQAVYSQLKYGIKVSEGAGENKKTIQLIDWQNPDNNEFAIAEEVSVKGENKKRPDIVIYVNGIALGILELKRSSVSVAEGIRQNLDNQKKDFIRNFFTTMQLVMAGNDSEGLRYGTIQTPESHFYQWDENKFETDFGTRLDNHLSILCDKARLLEIIHDFTVFDNGIKKIPRHNQYYGVRASQEYTRRGEGGIIWHTQGSGKSLTMVWLAKWLRENLTDARVVVITDRTELDGQIEGVFQGVDEDIYRTKSGSDLIACLNDTKPWLLCSLVHKFGRSGEVPDDEAAQTKDTDEFIKNLQRELPSNFKAKGNIFVFVDECHRTQSGSLHNAMKAILPEAVFIGFTGTPLLKIDKATSIEVFGGFIHTYKFDQAVRDKVVLDLRYEPRDIDQYVGNQKKIDEWFEAKTADLTDFARSQLKQRWGTMRKLLSSQSRLEQIVKDILYDMATKPRLESGRGNAMLVCDSIFQACKVFELFQSTELKGKCAIVTSYQPSPSDITGEETGEGMTEKLRKYEIYRRMLADYFEIREEEAMYKVDSFEDQVKDKFKNQPGQMRILIVVDKLLTGFDAPSATYLYIDKKMQDHGLFQAICRVNRLDGDDKEYGYIVDYKDLFKSLEGAVADYTHGALDGYDPDDVKGLLTDRVEKGREKLDDSLEAVRELCEPVPQPKELNDYIRFFCGDVANSDDLKAHELRRINLYKLVGSLTRAYLDLASEMEKAGYSAEEAESIKREVDYFDKVKSEVKLASGDHVDMKQYEPAMRHLLDQYINARDSQSLMEFEELGVLEVIMRKGETGAYDLEKAMGGNREAVAETIENNVRKIIVDESPVNPKYYEKMSELLDALIEQRRSDVMDYKKYLEEIKALAEQVTNPSGTRNSDYPDSLDTAAKRALFDNLDGDEKLAVRVDAIVRDNKEAHWVGDRFKERKIRRALKNDLENSDALDLDGLLELVKNQAEYR